MPLTKGKLRLDHERKIRKNIVALKRDMDAKDLTDYFMEKEIFDFPDVQMINGYNPNTAESRNSCFLQLLFQSGDQAYDVFLYALRENGLEHLAECIENTELPDGDISVSQSEPHAWIKDVPSNIRTRRLKEKDISHLSQTLGNEWEFIAYDLGLSEVEVQHCKMEHHSPVMQIYAALNRWRSRNPDTCTLETFFAIAKNSRATTVDWVQMGRIAMGMDSD